MLLMVTTTPERFEVTDNPNDEAPSVMFARSEFSGSEGPNASINGQVVFTVELDNVSDRSITLTYMTADTDDTTHPNEQHAIGGSSRAGFELTDDEGPDYLSEDNGDDYDFRP